MASAAAALLDELMGRHRNEAPDSNRVEVKWDDREVCKYFLCGFCPSELFTNTRADLGPCDRLHDEELRKQYHDSGRQEAMGFEDDFVKYLTSLLTDVERRIQRGHARLSLNSMQAGPGTVVANDREGQLDMLTTRINELVEEAEQAGTEGKVEEAQGIMKLCDQLREERTQLENNKMLDDENAKRMEVCDTCGALLVAGDAQQRIDEHIMGKQHMGYAKIRSYIDDRKEKLENLESEKETKRVKEREDREKEKEREQRERRKRIDDRDRERQRDRKDPRDTTRRRRSHSRGRRSRSRSRDRNRRSSRSKDRRSRDRRRSRSREHRSSRNSSRDKDTDRHRASRDKDHSGRDKERTSRDKDRHRDRRSRSRSRDRRGHHGDSKEKRRSHEKSGREEPKVDVPKTEDNNKEDNNDIAKIENNAATETPMDGVKQTEMKTISEPLPVLRENGDSTKVNADNNGVSTTTASTEHPLQVTE